MILLLYLCSWSKSWSWSCDLLCPKEQHQVSRDFKNAWHWHLCSLAALGNSTTTTSWMSPGYLAVWWEAHGQVNSIPSADTFRHVRGHADYPVPDQLVQTRRILPTARTHLTVKVVHNNKCLSSVATKLCGSPLCIKNWHKQILLPEIARGLGHLAGAVRRARNCWSQGLSGCRDYSSKQIN